MAEHTPLPWAYRPNKHDDWGWIRGPVMEGEEIGELVARAHCWATDEEKDAHRRDKTDPYGANAALIVKAVNNHEALVEALEMCRDALASCYQVTDWPADGKTSQDLALARANSLLNVVVGGSGQ